MGKYYYIITYIYVSESGLFDLNVIWGYYFDKTVYHKLIRIWILKIYISKYFDYHDYGGFIYELNSYFNMNLFYKIKITLETTKQDIKLDWSQAYSLENFNDNNLLKEELNGIGIYLNIISMNGFNRITYIGEGNILERWNKYYRDYHCDNDNEGHTVDLSKIKGDPYDIYSKKIGNTIEKIINKILYLPKTYKKECSKDFLQIRSEYFDKCYISFAKNEKLNQTKFRKEVQRNLQQYFINTFDILDYQPGCNLIGGSQSEKNNFNPNISIINYYEDNKLENLPFRIEF